MQESIHVHMIDEKHIIEEYRQNGFDLVERTKPTIIAQMGFVKLIFAKGEDLKPAPVAPDPKKFRLW